MIKKVCFGILLLAVLMVPSFLVTAETDYFPLAVGNEWTYERSGQVIEPQKILVTVTEKVQPSGGVAPFFKLNNYNGQAHLVRNSNGMVQEYPNYLWYLLNAEFGQTWIMRINTTVPGVIPCTDGAVLTVVSRNETVTVPAGSFSTVHIRFQNNCADVGITDEWFAPGVGMVKRVETSFTGPIVTELLRAIIVWSGN